ncbi:Choline/Carnitine o-acyltransferase family protein [Acanthocheilonema viteae]
MQVSRKGISLIRFHEMSTGYVAQKLKGEDYQYVHKSDIPTYHFQRSLRRLPIPKLADSCRRLIGAAEAVLQKGELELLKELVEDFMANEGPKLQKELVLHDKRNLHTSFISELWFDMYLSDRLPCPINYNPFMVYAPDPDPTYNDQVTRATNLIISYGRIKRALDAECLAPEIYCMNPKVASSTPFKWICKNLSENLRWYGAAAFGAFPLDMSQYKSLFGGSRIPQKGKDWLLHCADSKHFIVLHGGRIYAVDLFDRHGSIVPAEQVQACLSIILSEQSHLKSEDCVGSLTALERDQWAKARSELSSVGSNSASLALIDNSLFVLCLDSLNSDDLNQLAENLLSGGDARNRWFDKCFQLIVDAQGMAAINFEHSWGDGVAILRLMEESFRDTKQNHFVHPNQTFSVETYLGNNLRPVEFMLTDSIRQRIQEAQAKHIAIGSKLCFSTAEYFEMNRQIIKQSKLSPDSIMQLAIQLTFYKLFKEFVPSYESCSTAAFLKGRTECVRSATCATTNAVLAIENNISNIGEYLKKCSTVHSQLVKEAATGQGFDRHLMGLRCTAERLGWSQPKLFNSAVYKYMNRFILSTSTLSTETITFGGFGPVVPDGFGIGYNVLNNKMGALISSYKNQRSADAFASSLLESLDVLKNIIVKQRRLLLKTLRKFASNYSNREVLTDYHYTPFDDDDDQGPRTSISRLNDEMQKCQQIGIGSISKYGFRLYDGQFLYGPVAIFPKAVLSWRILTPDDITPESVQFFTMLEPKLDVLIVGPGERQYVDPVRRRIAPFLSKHKIGLEIMHSAKAAMLFNMLNVEYRCVAAALYPPDDMLITTNDQVRLMNMYGKPLDDGMDLISDTDDKLKLAKKAIRKYLPKNEAKQMDNLRTSRFLIPGESDDKNSEKAKNK